MGFFRRLLNGKKRIQGFQGPPPQESEDDRPAPPESLDPCDMDNLSVASYESGDENPVGYARETLETESADGSHAYEGLELAFSEFRILSLSPSANREDDIRCILRKTNFKTNLEVGPRYEALSYAWGNASEKRLIYVNDQPFSVTINLDIALRYLRKTNVARDLWIDAICINQDDIAEKTHQVNIMRLMYSVASRVLIWLGESDKDIRKAGRNGRNGRNGNGRSNRRNRRNGGRKDGSWAA
ncbi:MAG: hypothetical protein Q9211_001286 [Gyalolechia sp. 1 TL-2023]